MPAISLVQAPVFYSHAFTAYAEFKAAPDVKGLVAQLKHAGLNVAAADDPAPTNVSVAVEARPVRSPESSCLSAAIAPCMRRFRSFISNVVVAMVASVAPYAGTAAASARGSHSSLITLSLGAVAR